MKFKIVKILKEDLPHHRHTYDFSVLTAKEYAENPARYIIQVCHDKHRLVSMNIFITEDGDRVAKPFVIIWNFKTGEELKRFQVDYLRPHCEVIRRYEIILKWPWMILILNEDNVARTPFLGKLYIFAIFFSF